MRLDRDGFCATCLTDAPAADLVPIPGRNRSGKRVEHLTCKDCRQAGLEVAMLRTYQPALEDLPRDRGFRGQA